MSPRRSVCLSAACAAALSSTVRADLTLYPNTPTPISVTGGHVAVYGTLNVQPGYVFTPESMTVAVDPANSLADPGVANFNGGTVSAGVVTIESGTLNVATEAAAASLTSDGLVNVGGPFTVSGPSVINGTLDIGAHGLFATGGLTTSAASTLQGSGVVRSTAYQIDGFVEPGGTGATGTLTLKSDSSTAFSGNYIVDLAYDPANPTADALVFDQAVQITPVYYEDFVIGGELRVNIPLLEAGQSFAVGQTFDVLKAASLSGTFEIAAVPNVYNVEGDYLGTFDVAYTPTTVRLTFVPEPALTLAALPLLAMLRRRRA